jgi:hypothetical protein
MAQWNAFMSIKAVMGKLPVNLIIVAEGDEERRFLMQHAERKAGAGGERIEHDRAHKGDEARIHRAFGPRG